MINVVIIIELLFVLIIVYKCCIEKGKIRINHIFSVSMGYVYYGIIPFLCYEMRIKFNDYAYDSLVKEYSKVLIHQRMFYVTITFFMYLFFLFGCKTKKVSMKRNIKTEKFSFRFSERILFIPLFLMGCWIIWLNRDFLMKGYDGRKNIYKGMFSAYSIILLSVFLMYLFSLKKPINMKKIFLNKWGINFCFFEFLLLSMGGRLYVLTSIFAVLICYSCYYSDGILIKHFLQLIFALTVIAGIIGMCRNGNSLVSIKTVFFNVLQEPLYTSFSSVTYLGNNNVNSLFALPKVLITGLINLIPTVIFPGKTAYMTDVFEMGKGIRAPLGATHYFVSFILNFGILGSLIVFFIFGKLMKRLYKKNSYIGKTIYCLISSNLAFTLYRDSLPISIVKNIVEFSVMIPLFIMALNQILRKSTDK